MRLIIRADLWGQRSLPICHPRSLHIRVHLRFEIFLQRVGAAGRIALPGLRGGLVQKFLFFNLSVIFSLARMGNVDYLSRVARQGGPTEMPFRLLGFSCWDDRSGRFFFTGLG
jgi:hypothetical protein